MKNHFISFIKISCYSILVFLFFISTPINLLAQIKVITTGDVGIGTSNPEVKLHVEGVIRSTALENTPPESNVCADEFGNLILCDPSTSASDNLGNHTATQDLDLDCHDIINSDSIFFCNGGSLQPYGDSLSVTHFLSGVKISPNPSFNCDISLPMLTVVGSALINGCVYVASDQRFKKNINQLSNALSKIRQMRAYSYQYNQEDFPDYSFGKGKTYGFLAQEIGQIAPELVRKNDEGYYSVNYIGMIPLINQAIKEQQMIIELKAKETQQLQHKMKKLALEVAELKTLVQSMNKE